jgi:hypothetical protein
MLDRQDRTISREELEKMAYELYLQRRAEDGHDEEDWLLASAEKELSAFLTAVNELFGAEQARQASEDWIGELAQTDLANRAPVIDWRRVTIAAAARLAGRVNGQLSRH